MKTILFSLMGLVTILTFVLPVCIAGDIVNVPGVKVGSDGSVKAPGVNLGSDGNVTVSNGKTNLSKSNCIVNSDSQTINLSCNGKKVVVNGDGNTIKCDGNSPILSVNGDGNAIEFTGKCAKLILNGEKNKVKLALIKSISANGDDNQVTWASAISGDKPSVVSSGENNVIAQKSIN